MQGYARLSRDSDSSGDHSSVEPPFTSKEEYHGGVKGRLLQLYRRWRPLPQAVPASGYLTLIPLSDERLKPRRTKLIVLLLLALAVGIALAVFFLVPRGVNAGEVEIQSQNMSWNVTKGTYQLNLLARIPINNPNYMSARVHGNLTIIFYEQQAGTGLIGPVRINPRSMPATLEVEVDASNVSPVYALTILNQCAAFPRKLIFFLRGYIMAEYMWQKQAVMPFDSYFMINCVNHNQMPEPEEDIFGPGRLAATTAPVQLSITALGPAGAGEGVPEGSSAPAVLNFAESEEQKSGEGAGAQTALEHGGAVR